MELAFVAFLMIAIVVSIVALAIGVPLAIGLMAYDVSQDRKTRTAEVKQAREVRDASVSIATKRGIARAFVIVGAVFWSFATFANLYSSGQTGAGEAALAALLPLGASLVTLVIGWYWERLTAAALMLGAIGVFAWGVVYQFSVQTWAIMAVMLIGPMVTASVLFWLARRDQEAYEAVTSLRPDLAFAFAARSSLHA